jgi:3-phenylpropionate/trans-cinnamate dioxygenase ferredoxin reductase subunit
MNSMSRPDSAGGHGVVIVGAGQAGLQVAASLRAGGYAGRIDMVGDEALPPYQRPPLSKAYLMGEMPRASLELKAPSFYAENAIGLHLGRRAVAIDRERREVRLEDGTALPYAHVVLATGARPRTLPLPGAELAGIHTFRDLADADTIAAAMAHVQEVAVIGGGFIGLEFAAVARKLGRAVTVIEAQGRLLARVAGEEISAFFLREHAAKGVRFAMPATLSGFVDDATGRVAGVALADGRMVPAQLVVVGIGVIPNDELALAAGLRTANGIVVDEWLRSSDPAIYAIGDVAQHPTPFARVPVRLESVQNAVDQGRAVAAAILGQPAPYGAVPWFWSDQYDLKLQTAGLCGGHDETVLRGDPSARKFSLFYYREGQLIAVDSVNAPADHMVSRRLLSVGLSPRPAVVADPATDLKALLAQAAARA